MTGDIPIVGLLLVADDLNHLCVGQDMGGADHLPIHLCCYHLVAHICVHMICKVHNSCSLHSQRRRLSSARAQTSIAPHCSRADHIHNCLTIALPGTTDNPGSFLRSRAFVLPNCPPDTAMSPNESSHQGMFNKQPLKLLRGTQTQPYHDDGT